MLYLSITPLTSWFVSGYFLCVTSNLLLDGAWAVVYHISIGSLYLYCPQMTHHSSQPSHTSLHCFPCCLDHHHVFLLALPSMSLFLTLLSPLPCLCLTASFVGTGAFVYKSSPVFSN